MPRAHAHYFFRPELYASKCKDPYVFRPRTIYNAGSETSFAWKTTSLEKHKRRNKQIFASKPTSRKIFQYCGQSADETAAVCPKLIMPSTNPSE